MSCYPFQWGYNRALKISPDRCILSDFPHILLQSQHCRLLASHNRGSLPATSLLILDRFTLRTLLICCCSHPTRLIVASQDRGSLPAASPLDQCILRTLPICCCDHPTRLFASHISTRPMHFEDFAYMLLRSTY